MAQHERATRRLASGAACRHGAGMSQDPSALFLDDGGRDNAPLRLPVVFLHSAGGNSGHFAAQLAHLREDRRALAVDLPGHGKSPRAESFEIPAVAAVVEAALTAHGVDRFVLVGHSWGGAVALALAARAPARVAGLLLLDPARDGTRLPAAEAEGLKAGLAKDYDHAIESYWASMLHESVPEVKERLMAELKAQPREVVLGAMRSLLTFDPVPALEKYRGARKSLYTRFNDNPTAYHRIVSDLPSHHLHGTGHWLHLDQPAEVNAAIDDFLLDVDPR